MEPAHLGPLGQGRVTIGVEHNPPPRTCVSQGKSAGHTKLSRGAKRSNGAQTASRGVMVLVLFGSTVPTPLQLLALQRPIEYFVAVNQTCQLLAGEGGP